MKIRAGNQGGGGTYRPRPVQGPGLDWVPNRGASVPVPFADTPSPSVRAPSQAMMDAVAAAARRRAQQAAEAAQKAAAVSGRIDRSYTPGRSSSPAAGMSVANWLTSKEGIEAVAARGSGSDYLFGGTGDYVVKRGYSVAPPENYRSWWSTPDRIDRIVPAVSYSTAKEAKAHWYLLSPQERNWWESAAAAGVKYKGQGSKTGQTLYGKMVEASAEYNKTLGASAAIAPNVKMDPATGMPMLNADGSYVYENVDAQGNPLPAQTADGKWTGTMDPESFLVWAVQSGTVTDGSAGNGRYSYRGGGGGGGGGGGSASATQTNISTALSSADEAKAILNNAAQNYLGRDATDEELEAFKKALNIREKKNPSKTVTTVTVSGSDTSAVTDVTGGVSADDKMQMGIETAKGVDDYDQYQMARYFRMFEGALS